MCSASRVRVWNRGPCRHGQLGADCCRHLILRIGGRVRVTSSFWPWFMPHRWGYATISEIAHRTWILRAYSIRSFLMIHTRPHIRWSNTMRSQTWKVILSRPIAHGMHVHAPWMVVGWVHTSFRRGSRLQGYGTWTQRGPMSWTHVGRLLLVMRLLVVWVMAHWVPRTNVASFNPVMLVGENKLIDMHHYILFGIIRCKCLKTGRTCMSHVVPQ